MKENLSFSCICSNQSPHLPAKQSFYEKHPGRRKFITKLRVMQKERLQRKFLRNKTKKLPS